MKINKIKLSGTSYDIEDKNAPKTVELTQAQYDAIVSAGTVDTNTFYVITDATPFDPSTKVDTSAITSSVTSASTDSQIPTAKAVYDAIPTGGSVTSGEVQTMINQSISGKADSSTVEYINGLANDLEERKIDLIQPNVDDFDNIVGFKYATDGGAGGDYEYVELFHVGEGLNIDYDYDYDYNKIKIDTSWLEEEVLAPVATTGDYSDLYNIPMIDNTVTSGSTNAVQGGAVYSQMGGLKLVKITQSAYDQLSTYDSNTLYIITNS